MTAFDIYPVGARIHHVVGPFVIEHEVASPTVIHARHVSGPRTGFAETLAVQVTPLRPGLYLLAWQEQDGSTVVCVEDFHSGTVHASITTAEGGFVHVHGLLTVVG